MARKVSIIDATKGETPAVVVSFPVDAAEIKFQEIRIVDSFSLFIIKTGALQQNRK